MGTVYNSLYNFVKTKRDFNLEPVFIDLIAPIVSSLTLLANAAKCRQIKHPAPHQEVCAGHPSHLRGELASVRFRTSTIGSIEACG